MSFSGCLICQQNYPTAETYSCFPLNTELALQVLCNLFSLPAVSQWRIRLDEISECGLCEICAERIQDVIKTHEEIKLLEFKIQKIKDEMRKTITSVKEGSTAHNGTLPSSSVVTVQKFLFQCLSKCDVTLIRTTESELLKYFGSNGRKDYQNSRSCCRDEETQESVSDNEDLSADPNIPGDKVGVLCGGNVDGGIDPIEFSGKGVSDEPQTEEDSVSDPHSIRDKGRARPRLAADHREPKKRAKTFRCHHCPKRIFKLQRDLAKHLAKAHDDQLPSVCKFCGFDFQAQRRLRNEHANTSNTSLNDASSSTVDSVTNASNTSAGGATASTSIPPATNKSSKSGSHLSEYVYVCGLDGCKLSYDSLAKLRIHHNSKCLDNPTVQANLSLNFPCSLCSKIYVRSSDLNYHVATVHEKTFRFCCEICGKGFQQLSRLKKHYVYHATELNFKCEECGMQFRRRDQLVLHSRKHTGDLTYVCEFCGKGFQQSGHLSRHRDGVHGEPKYPCEICGKLFRALEYVQLHVKSTHLGLYKYGRRKQKREEKTAGDTVAATAISSN